MLRTEVWLIWVGQEQRVGKEVWVGFWGALQAKFQHLDFMLSAPVKSMKGFKQKVTSDLCFYF